MPYRRAASNWLLVLGVLLIIATLGVFWIMYESSSDKTPLTDTENVLLSAITLIFGTLGSILLTLRASASDAEAKMEQLARPAWRRVVQLAKSADLIRTSLQEKLDSLPAESDAVSKDIVSEWLSSVDYLVAQHQGQVEDAISDWHDVLRDQFTQIAELRKLEEQLKQQLAEREAALATLKTTNVQLAEEQAERVSALQKEIASLRRSIATKTYDFVTTTGTSPSASSLLLHGSVSPSNWTTSNLTFTDWDKPIGLERPDSFWRMINRESVPEDGEYEDDEDSSSGAPPEEPLGPTSESDDEA